MRRGSSKGKGSSYERTVCKKLSLWVTDGKLADCFWRSSLSGGRATVAHRKGESVRQAGDICSVSPEGHVLTDRLYVECKHYKDLDFAGFFLKGTGKLAKFWQVAVREAQRHGREPMLIARQNNYPDIIVTRVGRLKPYCKLEGMSILVEGHKWRCEVRLLEEVLNSPWVGLLR